MFQNYFKTAWRNILRNRIFSIIEISSLSIGLTVCMLILLYTKDEISFDRFHQNKSRIYRIVQTMQVGQDHSDKMGITMDPLGPAYAKDIPSIEKFVRINEFETTVKIGNQLFTEKPLFVDPDFFNVFSFTLIKGKADAVLRDLYSVVLSADYAKKYFGSGDPVGKTIQIKLFEDFENFTVSGVSENAPQNSSIRFDFLLPLEYYNRNNLHDGWIGGSVNTFLLVRPKTDTGMLVRQMQSIFDQHTSDQIAQARKAQGISIRVIQGIQPITAIHLDSSIGTDNGIAGGSDRSYSYLLTGIAIFILIIACINFINLAVSQSLKRSKEIGVRKVMGGTRKQLMGQFLAESFVVSLIAFLFAIVMTALVLPIFNELANKKLSLSYLADANLYLGYLLLLLLTSFIAGFYPALVLSGFQPVKVLYSRQKLMGRNHFTRSLIVLQFALAIFLIIATIAVSGQLNYLSEKDLGYDSKNLVRIDLPFNKNNDNLIALLKQELLKDPAVLRVAARNRGRAITGVKAEGKEIEIDENAIDENFFPTFRIPIVAGRNFSAGSAFDSSQSVIVNESFIGKAGWSPGEAIGKQIHSMEGKEIYTIIGVIRDYHFLTLKQKISPQFFSMRNEEKYGQIWVKINGDQIPRTLGKLEQTLKKLSPFYPFELKFMEDINTRNYEDERRWKEIISIASALFIFISCVGLLGLVMLSVEQRTKEIGIRKVLGAAVARIVFLICREFLAIVSLSFVIAAPAGYIAVKSWLQNFAYRMNITWTIFALAALLILTLASITLGLQAIRAAMANPAKSLRTD
ncbi:MAG: ABC transporter permease [Chitinophagales bacterium]